jgi:hypothetical protein
MTPTSDLRGILPRRARKIRVFLYFVADFAKLAIVGGSGIIPGILASFVPDGGGLRSSVDLGVGGSNPLILPAPKSFADRRFKRSCLCGAVEEVPDEPPIATNDSGVS